MPVTNSDFTFIGFIGIGASIVAASFHLCAMSETYSLHSGLFGVSIVAAAFLLHIHAMPHINLSMLGIGLEPHVAAAFHFPFCTMMSNTHSALNDTVCASLMAAAV